jgi:hypothetical protein
MSMPRGIEVEPRKMYSPASREMPWDKGETSLRSQEGQEKIAILLTFLALFLFPTQREKTRFLEYMEGQFMN